MKITLACVECGRKEGIYEILDSEDFYDLLDIVRTLYIERCPACMEEFHIEDLEE